jgi:hypothetical protein
VQVVLVLLVVSYGAGSLTEGAEALFGLLGPELGCGDALSSLCAFSQRAVLAGVYIRLPCTPRLKQRCDPGAAHQPATLVRQQHISSQLGHVSTPVLHWPALPCIDHRHPSHRSRRDLVSEEDVALLRDLVSELDLSSWPNLAAGRWSCQAIPGSATMARLASKLQVKKDMWQAVQVGGRGAGGWLGLAGQGEPLPHGRTAQERAMVAALSSLLGSTIIVCLEGRARWPPPCSPDMPAFTSTPVSSTRPPCTSLPPALQPQSNPQPAACPQVDAELTQGVVDQAQRVKLANEALMARRKAVESNSVADNSSMRTLMQAGRLRKQAAALQAEIDAVMANSWNSFMDIVDILIQTGGGKGWRGLLPGLWRW